LAKTKMDTGSKAIDFEFKDREGNQTSLFSILKDKVVVLYFYPKDNTPGCTAQACSFRDSYQDFKDVGAEVIGVSSDSSESHDSFAEKQRLPFILVSDTNGNLRKKYDVPSSDIFGFIPGRVTYVIDKNKTIRYVFSSQLQLKKHAEKALEIISFINQNQ